MALSLLQKIQQGSVKAIQRGLEAVKSAQSQKSYISRVSNSTSIEQAAQEIAKKFAGKTNLNNDPEWLGYPLEIRKRAYEIMTKKKHFDWRKVMYPVITFLIISLLSVAGTTLVKVWEMSNKIEVMQGQIERLTIVIWNN